MTTLTLPQLALGAYVAAGDIIARVRLLGITVGESTSDITLDITAPTATRVFNDRIWSNPTNSHNYLAAQITTAEAVGPGDGVTWTTGVSTQAGARHLYRAQDSGEGTLDWIELPHSRLTPEWFGFTRMSQDPGDDDYNRIDAMNIGGTDAIFGGHMAGLWLPPDPPSEGPGLVGVGQVGVSKSVYDNSPSLVLDYGERQEGLLVWEMLYGAWMWIHHASDAAFQAGTPDYATNMAHSITDGDDLAALEALARTHRTCGPLRYWPDRDDLGVFVDLEVDDAGWLGDLRGFVELQERSPAHYRVQIPVKLWREGA